MRPASEYDATPIVEMIERQEQHVGLRPRALLSDGAYGTADARAALRDRQNEVVAKLRPLTDRTHIGKDEFTIELAAKEGQGRVTCPEGVTTMDGTISGRDATEGGEKRTSKRCRQPRW